MIRIREATTFTYASTPSSDFDIINININTGLQEEPLVAERSILEIKTTDNVKPYFNELSHEPLKFTISFAFEDTFDEDTIDNVVNWLCNYDFYQPLYFDSDTDRIYYALVVEKPMIVHNCLSQGYVNLTFQCNDSYIYSDIITSDVYTVPATPTISLTNDGNINCYPTIYITKIGNGDLSIVNLTTNTLFEFTDLSNNEILTIFCEDEVIESDSGSYRYSNFNDNYLYLLPGSNNLLITGACSIYFKYQYKQLT